MKLGEICRAENIGLGVQTFEFYRHMNPGKVMVVDLTKMNGNKLYPERFPTAHYTKLLPRRHEIQNFVQGLTHIFTCETPYDYFLFEYASRRGIKTILQFNYEFFEWFQQPKVQRPTVFASPSYWHLEEMQRNYGAVYLPVPVNRDVLPFERKKQFKNFLHLAGIRVDHDRNGTESVLKVFSEMKRTDVKLTVKCQNKAWVEQWRKEYPGIIIEANNCDNYYDNYKGFDCLVFPRKYGGLCLPMQEALSTGMPVIMTDLSPNDRVLPKEWLVPCRKEGDFQARTKIDVYGADPTALFVKVNEFADMNEQQAGQESDKADKIASELDWKVWKSRYLEFMANV